MDATQADRPRRLVDMAKSLSRMSSSAQLLMTGAILEGVNLLLCALALIPMADANLATTLLLLFLGVYCDEPATCAHPVCERVLAPRTAHTLFSANIPHFSAFYGSSPSCFPAKFNPPVRLAMFTISVGSRGLRCECVCFV